MDLSSGFIWGELNDQVNKWIERINEYGITKWVLYLSALEEGERIEPEDGVIYKDIGRRKGFCFYDATSTQGVRMLLIGNRVVIICITRNVAPGQDN